MKQLNLSKDHYRAIAGAILLLLVGVAVLTYLEPLQQVYQSFLSIRQEHAAIFFVSFVILFVVAALTSIFPASLLGVAAGAAFGFVTGFMLSAASLLAAALIAFLIGRFFFRATSRRIIARFFDLEKLESRLAKYGWRYALLIRSAPLAPFGITSYGLGLTPIGLVPYLTATLGAFPFLGTCVYLGSIGHVVASQGGGVDQQFLWKIAALFSGAILALGFVIKLLPGLARRFERSMNSSETLPHKPDT